MHKDNIHHWSKKHKNKLYKTGDKRDDIAKVYRHCTVSTDFIQVQQEFGCHLSKYVTSESTYLLQKQTVV